MIKREQLVEVHLTPEELAAELYRMGDDEQAVFFNRLGELAMSCNNPFSLQLHAIIVNPRLANSGRWIMRQIGEYAEAET